MNVQIFLLDGFMAAMFAQLSARNLRSAMAALQTLAEQNADCRSFVVAALEQLTGVVASDLTTLSICDLERGTRRVISRSGEALSDSDRAAFDRHFREHPLVRFHGTHPGGPTQRISDCMGSNDFRHSALHADYYRRIGINYVMALPLRIDRSNVISVVFNRRDMDFKDTERGVLDVLRLPLAAIYRNLAACEDAGLGLQCVRDLAVENGWQLIRISITGRILEASVQALSLLERFFGGADSRDSRLPPLLAEWFAQTRSWGLERPAISRGQQFTTSRLGAKLIVHFVPDPQDASAGFLLMKSERLRVRAETLAHLALTQREREVVALVAAGKTNAEIAAVLSISARTVQKHLEHIFPKLGVETRTAVALRALTAADEYVSRVA
jgi:DNA-binding CsgD family transcriptional regulator